MSIELTAWSAVDDGEKEKIKNAVAETLNDEGIDVKRVNLEKIKIDDSGKIEAKLTHK